MTLLVALFARAWIEINDYRYEFFTTDVALFARAWIEIKYTYRPSSKSAVALFARAWIEILIKPAPPISIYCRPLCEGVD